MQVLPSNNEHWGLYGTIERACEDRVIAQHAWETASKCIAETTKCSPEAVRDFLDSRDGRHFADMVADRLVVDRVATSEAVRTTVSRWMRWSVTARSARDMGLPYGKPLLLAMVASFQTA